MVHANDEMRKRWYAIADPILGFRLELHDFRKVFATWLIILGVQFNDVAKLNCGWADLDTLDKAAPSGQLYYHGCNYNQSSVEI